MKAIEKDRHRESRTFHNIHNTTFLWIMHKQTVEKHRVQAIGRTG